MPREPRHSSSEQSSRSGRKNRKSGPALPPATDWRTTDADEIARRQLRAREERMRIRNLTHEHPIFSNFRVDSQSGLTYEVEIRELSDRQCFCTCTDFRINGLGTCKHVEAVLLHLSRREKAAFKAAGRVNSPRIDLVPDPSGDRLRIERGLAKLSPRWRALFDAKGYLARDLEPAAAVERLLQARVGALRVSREVDAWLNSRRAAEERILARRDYETGVASGRHPEHETKLPLFPYQREGMLHLAFTGRALLADEMGLGKTIQAVAACSLLHRLGLARRVLIVTPASLKAEWEEQIRRFTDLPLRLVFGGPIARVRLYDDPSPPFFTIANYEQVVPDSLDINARLKPDIVVLDEAQRIKNWATKTAQAVKRLDSRFAFVLTGTPIENRIDELRSIVDFLDPSLLGPLFRFNREYYTLDERGRPEGYRNLDQLRERVRPVLLRRRKAQVETELPDRTDRNLFVAMTPTQRTTYEGYETEVGKLVSIAKRRPLTPKEQDLLMILLNMMRMVCDTPAIIKTNPCRDCPKLEELARVLEECLADPDVKVIVFSEWEGMLSRVREWADSAGVGYAWHTGAVPQQRRRAEILAFRNDPDCRLFLSTDSGGIGLNLQNASVVVNCDLPWNPAKLEQRIARAWRKNQLRPVTVVNLVAENTIEHGMLGSLANKMELAQGVLDGKGDLATIKLKRGAQALLRRLEQVMARVAKSGAPVPPQPPSDPAVAFAAQARASLGRQLVTCEETYAPGSDVPIVFAVVRAGADDIKPRVTSVFESVDWRGNPPTLQVVDSTTWQTLRDLAAAGLISIHTRATRPLLAADEGGGPPILTPEQQERARALRELSSRRARAARALLAEDLLEDATSALRGAALARLQADAIEAARDIPPDLGAALRPPYVSALPESLLPAWQTLLATDPPSRETLHQILGAC
jgi:hypothetical protein